MAFTPENSALRLSPAQEKQVAAMSPEQMKVFFASLAVERGLANQDAYDPSILHVTQLAGSAPKRFAKVLRINGQQHILEEDSPEALVAAETELYRSLFANQDATPNASSTDEPRDPNTGRFISEQQAQQDEAAQIAARAELELQFKRGDITTQEFLEQSGAIDSYLASQGVSLDDLRQATEKNYTTNWENATSEFLAQHPEWPGGEHNRELMGQAIIDRGLQDQPSSETLERVYDALRKQNLLTANPETVAAQKQYNDISRANSVEEIRKLAGGGGYFGAR